MILWGFIGVYTLQTNSYLYQKNNNNNNKLLHESKIMIIK